MDQTLTSHRPSTTAAIHLYLDIETVPSQEPAVKAAIFAKYTVASVDLDAIEPAANLRDPDKVAVDIEKRRAKAVADHAAAVEKARVTIDEEWRKTALDGAVGHLASIAWTFDEAPYADVAFNTECEAFRLPENGKPSIILGPGLVRDGEKALLEDFFDSIEAVLQTIANEARSVAPIIPVIVAHFAGFDIRFIWQRAIILGVRLPTWWPVGFNKYRQDQVIDTMTMWAGSDGRISLDNLCVALGVPGKGDVDGSKVWDLVRSGRIADVTRYNADDIGRLRAVHRRMSGLPDIDFPAAANVEEAA